MNEKGFDGRECNVSSEELKWNDHYSGKVTLCEYPILDTQNRVRRKSIIS